ncbi:MAG: sporulation protein YunB [Oscillospiraceae bacterium]|nr:sporulation protein YunB [Oscillospiraceae bacterium]
MRIRYSYYRKQLTRRQKRGLVFIGFGLVLLVLGLGLSRNLVPVMTEMAIHQSYELVTAAVNEAIHERLLDGTLSYSELVILQRDLAGNITALTTDMAQINTLQAAITNEVIARISEIDATTMRVPLGNIVGGAVLSGRGPGVRFRVVTLGNPSATFTNEFSTAGINQTKHQIMLEIAIQVNILIPGHATQETITTQMLIAETIIVGDVPHVFGQFGMG